jgi:hypothetical protein
MINFEFGNVAVEVYGSAEDKQAIFSACVRVGDIKKGTGRCHATKSSARELARQVIESYFSHETPPEGSELARVVGDTAIYIVPFSGVYVIARRIAYWIHYDHFKKQHFYRYDWVVETWHTTLEATRRAAALV